MLYLPEVCGNGWSKRAWQDEANEKQTLQCMIGPKNSRRNGRERERGDGGGGGGGVGVGLGWDEE